ncbi:MAG: 50S ribosomal protein L14 [Nitrososphaeria archaeon]
MPEKTRAVSAKGVQEYKPHITKSIPVPAIINCADNTGAKKLKLIQVIGYKGRLRRIPAASVGDEVVVVVKVGTPEVRKQIFHAVIVRQKYPVRRLSGDRISFEDNAAVLITPEGELKGTEIRGPVAMEAAERWPRIANIAYSIV